MAFTRPLIEQSTKQSHRDLDKGTPNRKSKKLGDPIGENEQKTCTKKLVPPLQGEYSPCSKVEDLTLLSKRTLKASAAVYHETLGIAAFMISI